MLPILIPLGVACVQVLLWRRPAAQQGLGVVGSGGLLIAAASLLAAVLERGAPVAVQVGGWTAPYGITLVADLLGAGMVLLTGIMGLAVAVYSGEGIDADRRRFGYYPFVSMLLAGVSGGFLTGDVFNLYVWFEVLLIASFVLMALGGDRGQLEGAIKYVTLNLVSSVLFLGAAGILYGFTGSLNMAHLATRLDEMIPPGLASVLAMVFVVAFGIKAAAFPLFFWLPASYHTPPVAVTALFAALLTKMGVYSLIRLFTLVFVRDVGYTHTALLVLGALTMITGVLGAVAQYDIRRLLSFHIVSQIGYLLMGLGLFTPLALAGTAYFLAHVILAKSTLFLLCGVIHRFGGDYDLKKLGNLYRERPGIAVLFLLPALSLAGIPPLSGFFAKLALVRAALESAQFGMVAAALGVSILTLYSMLKIWNEAFWKPRPAEDGPPPPGGDPPAVRPESAGRRSMALLVAPTAALTVVGLLLGLAAEPVLQVAGGAAAQLLDPAAYVRAVLGEGGAP